MTRGNNSILRKSTNLSLDAHLVAQAKGLDINISRVAEEGIARAVSEERARLWKIENREAIDFWNGYIEEHGLPLEEFRQF
ncbi:MAG TPA: type II toxin-antitoxin system CcdA family antitoxin [Mesorhizobium sp.]|jgi:antitoxin CcdA